MVTGPGQVTGDWHCVPSPPSLQPPTTTSQLHDDTSGDRTTTPTSSRYSSFSTWPIIITSSSHHHPAHCKSTKTRAVTCIFQSVLAKNKQLYLYRFVYFYRTQRTLSSSDLSFYKQNREKIFNLLYLKVEIKRKMN